MPWSDSPDYEPPIRARDILGIISLLLIFLVAYELTPSPHHTDGASAAHAVRPR